MTVLKIALLGAPHTGKSQLATALTESLKSLERQALVVVADTPELQAGMGGYDLTLLMGLETAADANVRGESLNAAGLAQESQAAADQTLRRMLAQAGVPYRVIYGAGEERLAQARHAIESLLQCTGKPMQQHPRPAGKPGAWVWICDKCSDPQCEHRLLTDLLAQRGQAV
ncbi:hypothetical protein [Polaromonas jejuensis]|uniref:Uncharacterized protein n=1 Tax=Polaromonas jejuensis TaxID=457502 RepID=A0ABW0Q4M8_9BURK|nr:hypothetical protein [Polaromonas jejuensis]